MDAVPKPNTYESELSLKLDWNRHEALGLEERQAQKMPLAAFGDHGTRRVTMRCVMFEFCFPQTVSGKQQAESGWPKCLTGEKEAMPCQHRCGYSIQHFPNRAAKTRHGVLPSRT